MNQIRDRAPIFLETGDRRRENKERRTETGKTASRKGAKMKNIKKTMTTNLPNDYPALLGEIPQGKLITAD